MKGLHRRIFVSYRREDSAGHAGRLADTLRAQGAGEVFLDVDTISLGEDFVQRIHREIERCDIVLVLIGKDWLAPAGPGGKPRIYSALDFVHLEVKAALERGIPVVPVLLHGARMPEPEALPEPVRALAYRHGMDLDPSSWSADVSTLVSRLPAVGGVAYPPDDQTKPPTALRADALPDHGGQGRNVRNTEGTDVAVVAAGLAYSDYLRTSGYVCQADRAFRAGTERLGFYLRKFIRPEFPTILHRRDNVLFTAESADALRGRGEPFDSEVASLIDSSFDRAAALLCHREHGTRYQVFCLSSVDDARTLLLERPIDHEAGSAWTQNQRYLSSEVLSRGPRTTAEL